MNVTETLAIADQITEQLAYGVYGPQAAQSTSGPSYGWNNGTAAATIDLHVEFAGTAAVTLAPGTGVTYILSALTDGLGRAVAFRRLRKLLLVLTARTDGDSLAVGAAATDPFAGTGTAAIPVRDALALVAQDAAGMVVAAGSADQLLINNPGAHPITFTLSLSGCSA
jgi:hypothetical protein